MNQTVNLRLVGAGLAHVLSDMLRLQTAVAVPGTLVGLYLGLFEAWPGFGLGLQVTDLTEPTYGGYARKLAVWGDEGVDGAQRPEVMGGLLQFQPTDSSVSSNVLGAFLADALAGGQLIAVGALGTPKVLGTPLDLLGLLPRIAVPGMEVPNWGEIVGIS